MKNNVYWFVPGEQTEGRYKYCDESFDFNKKITRAGSERRGEESAWSVDLNIRSCLPSDSHSILNGSLIAIIVLPACLGVLWLSVDPHEDISANLLFTVAAVFPIVGVSETNERAGGGQASRACNYNYRLS